MARRETEFQTIRSEGGLLPSDLLQRILDTKERLPGTNPEDYGLPRTERVNEVITQSWNRLRKHWIEFRAETAAMSAADPATGPTNDKWSLPLLRELGFGPMPTSAGPEISGRTYAISRFVGPVPVHLVGCGVDLDRRAAGVRGAAAVNPHGLVQEFVNRSPGHLWAIVSNGLRLRVLRDNQALSRQSFLEFDVEAMFAGEVYSDFVLLWLTAHATRFAPREGERPDTCWLEEWTKEADRRGARVLGDLRGGVEKALQLLGEGFTSHPNNTELRKALRSGSLQLTDFHGQLLRVVYRLIFLFVAEDRTLDGQSLLHRRDGSETARDARERFATHYGTGRLRHMAGRIKGSRHGDLWQQFQVLVGALSGDQAFAGARELLGLPALGSLLWNPASTGMLNDAELTNYDLLEALRHLAFTRSGRALRPVNYRNLGAEELGGIYESLLALTPQISADGARFSFAEFAGNERKTSGSYYTPDSLVQSLLDSALNPVVDAAVKGKTGVDAERAILALKVCDPAVGSGHFLVGAAHRLARHLSRARALTRGESEPSPVLYQHSLRDVIGRCLYGVDLNPMAAELCRVSLWLEALEPGKPLSFLDHHIRVGNSLLGATPELIASGVPDEAFSPIEGDDRKACAVLKKRNKAERKGLGPLFVQEEEETQALLAHAAAALETLPDDRPEDIQAKELALRHHERTEQYRQKKRLADLWCSAFVTRKYFSEVGRDSSASGITQAHLNLLASGRPLQEEVATALDGITTRYGFFHWHLVFPDVFAKGGFDCVLGNPPWETMELSDKEFFAESGPEITKATTRSRRKKAIEGLETTDPGLYNEYGEARRQILAARSFIQNSGAYPLSAYGRINSGALFTELAFGRIHSEGYVGLITPSSLITEAYNRHFFDALFSGRHLVSAYEFENRSRLFPSVHPQFRFCLLTITRQVINDRTVFVFAAQDPSDLVDEDKRILLEPADVACVNPNTKTTPILTTRRDADICLWAHRRHPILHREADDLNPYEVECWTTFYIKDASAHFVSRSEWPTDQEAVVVYEGKMCHQFDHRFASFNPESSAIDGASLDKANPALVATPRYVVARTLFEDAVKQRPHLRWFLGVRDITNPTNERTSIAFVYPRSASFDTIRNMTPTVADAGLVSAFLANLNCFAFDYFARQKLTGNHFTFSYSKQVPVIDPADVRRFSCGAQDTGAWLRDRVLELTFTAWDLEPFARDCGWTGTPFPWNEERRFILRCELDAAFFHLYFPSDSNGDWVVASTESAQALERLKARCPNPRDAVAYIMDTFPIVRRKDEEMYGDYRTKLQILQIYDRMQEAMATRTPYQTLLNPPPADPRTAHSDSTRPPSADIAI